MIRLQGTNYVGFCSFCKKSFQEHICLGNDFVFMNKLATCKVLRLKINSLVAVIAPSLIHKMMFIAPHKNYITTHQAHYTIITISVL